MTDPVKKIKNASQDVEAKMKTSKDHAKGKPSSEKLNKAKVKVRDALTWPNSPSYFYLSFCVLSMRGSSPPDYLESLKQFMYPTNGAPDLINTILSK
jgi:hypothetical protein